MSCVNGVLVDIARRVQQGIPVDLSMGYVNVIWQRDANDIAIRALGIADSPPEVFKCNWSRNACCALLSSQVWYVAWCGASFYKLGRTHSASE